MDRRIIDKPLSFNKWDIDKTDYSGYYVNTRTITSTDLETGTITASAVPGVAIAFISIGIDGLTIGKTYTLSFDYEASSQLASFFVGSNNHPDSGDYATLNRDNGHKSVTFTAVGTKVFIKQYFQYSASPVKTVEYSNLMLNEGSEHTFVKYGCYEDGTVITPIQYVALETCGQVDMGTLTWNHYHYSSSEDFVQAHVPDIKDATWFFIAPITYTAAYSTQSGHNFRMYGTGYTDANAFKQAVQGVMLTYELANPKPYAIKNVITI